MTKPDRPRPVALSADRLAELHRSTGEWEDLFRGDRPFEEGVIRALLEHIAWMEDHAPGRP